MLLNGQFKFNSHLICMLFGVKLDVIMLSGIPKLHCEWNLFSRELA